MKILHVETGRHFYGGAQQVVWLAGGLLRRGSDNLLVCTPDSAVAEAATAAGIVVATLPCAGDLDLSFAWRLRQLLQKERPDIVHCHSRRGADFLGGQAAAMAGIPAVLSRRVDSPHSRLGAALRYRAFRKVIAISAHVAAVLEDAGLQRDKLVVIRSAVTSEPMREPADTAEVRRQFGIEPGVVALASAGQLIARKGHGLLLQALAGIRSPSCKLVIFGAGPLRDELQNDVARLKLADRVSLAGFRDDFDRLLGGFDMLVHPATREGLGVVMLQAAAAALPVVAFDAAGAREAVANGESGLLVPAQDVPALRAAIVELAGDPGRRLRLGAAGRQRMRREFAVSDMVDAHLELYQSVLRG